MDLITKIKGLTYLGWATCAGSLAYSFKRAAIDRKFKDRSPRKTFRVGKLVSSESIESGMAFQFENARLEAIFVIPGVPRLTWTPGELPLTYVVARTEFNPVTVSVRQEKESYILESNGLSVTVHNTGKVTFTTSAGVVLRTDDAPAMTKSGWKNTAAMQDDEAFFGMGMKASPFNVRGQKFKLWNMEPQGAYAPGDDPLYVSAPTYLSVAPRGSYLIFFDNTFKSWFSFKDRLEALFEGGAIRYYFFAGSPEDSIRRYYDLIGHPAMPPKWAMGFHQCRWSYMNEAEVREVAEGFKKRDLPLSSIHLDIHYMNGHRVFTVDPARFPDMKHLADDLLEDGVRLVTILDPGVKIEDEYPLYREGCEQDLFLKLPDGSLSESLVWPGMCGFPDFSKPETRQWWAKQYKFLIDRGISGFWHDMNEPAAFAAWGDCTLPDSTLHSMEGRGGTHLEGHNVYGLLEAVAGFEGQKMFKPERRPWILSRSGWPGLARYSWHWTGDVESNWWSVAQTLRIVMNLTMSGIPYSGGDIGGFGGEPDKELFVRWFEMSSMFPFFRVHSAFFTKRREPWCFDEETLDITRVHLKRRYSLLSYWYTLAAAATRTGRTLMRPMFMEDQNMVDVDDQFMAGNAIMVAPVLKKGSAEKIVKFPAGTWYDWESGEKFGNAGSGSSATIAAPLGVLPMFAKAGSIVPVDIANAVQLRLFVPAVDGIHVGGELYRDAGDGYGAWLLEQFGVTREGGTVKITRKATGEFKPTQDGFVLQIVGAQTASIEVDGQQVQATDGTFAIPAGFTTIII